MDDSYVGLFATLTKTTKVLLYLLILLIIGRHQAQEFQ